MVLWWFQRAFYAAFYTLFVSELFFCSTAYLSFLLLQFQFDINWKKAGHAWKSELNKSEHSNNSSDYSKTDSLSTERHFKRVSKTHKTTLIQAFDVPRAYHLRTCLLFTEKDFINFSTAKFCIWKISSRITVIYYELKNA